MRFAFEKATSIVYDFPWKNMCVNVDAHAVKPSTGVNPVAPAAEGAYCWD
jgi:hypothetical protein